MDTKINYTAVGAFVIILLAAMIFSIAWLSAGISFSRYGIYKIYMSESVSGLNIDSAVEYNGVVIGNVSSMDINKENPHLVELLLQIKTGTPITVGTRATLHARGITGTAYIALQDNGKNLTPLTVLNGEAYPVIKTLPSLFLRLDSALSDMATNIKEVTRELRTILSPENQESFRKTLGNMREISNTIANNNQSLSVILQNTANSLQVFEQQTLPTTNQALNNITDLSNELKRNPALLIRGRAQPQLGPGEQ